MKKRKNKKGVLKWRYIVGYCIVLTFLAITGFIWFQLRDLPKIDAQYLLQYRPTVITDKNDNVIYTDATKRFEPMVFEEIPKLYQDTLVAVEDQSFWDNKGVSIPGLVNMIWTTVQSQFGDTRARGGSTLTQQLIKNIYLNRGENIPTIKRKIQEIFLALQMNENYSKQDILTMYVNHIEYNEGAVGLKTIMRTYFNKSPEDYSDLGTDDIVEMAYLVGLGQAPTGYNLYTNPNEAKSRTHVVLSVMRDKNLITDIQYNDAIQYDLTKNLQPRYWQTEAQQRLNMKYLHYTQGVLSEMQSLGYNLDNLSVRIKTHLDKDLYDRVVELVKDRKYVQDNDQEIATTIIDHEGKVVAMVGSRKDNDEYNRATQTVRSSGSSMKPFTAYAPLLEYFGDKYTTASTFSGSAYRYPGTNSIMYNYGRTESGQTDMQRALRLSLNTTVARIDDEILGSANMKAFLKQNGLDNRPPDYHYSALDGIGINVSTLQSAAAYNSLNNMGVYTQPRFVDQITFSDGSVKIVKARQHQSMSPSVAYVTLQMLRGVPQSTGTATSAVIPQFQGYAGKTGLVGFADNVNPPAPYGYGSSDVWYNSVTHGGYAISVWTGYDEPNTSPQVSDVHRGSQVLSKDLHLMLNANNEKAKVNWKQPEGVVKISGDNLSAHYKVNTSTKAQSVTQFDDRLYNDLSRSKVQSNATVPLNWEESLTAQDKQLLQVQDFDVLPAGIYNLLR